MNWLLGVLFQSGRNEWNKMCVLQEILTRCPPLKWLKIMRCQHLHQTLWSFRRIVCVAWNSDPTWLPMIHAPLSLQHQRKSLFNDNNTRGKKIIHQTLSSTIYPNLLNKILFWVAICAMRERARERKHRKYHLFIPSHKHHNRERTKE